MKSALPWRHVALALLVILVWGTNFVITKIAFAQIPPLLFAALRFTFAVIPAIFFIKRPDVPWRNLAAYGLLIGVGQFGLLYVAMNGQISPGLAPVVVQSQVLFTILLSVWIEGERVRVPQWMALAMAVTGIAVIAAHADRNTTILGLVLVLLAAVGWAGGNTVTRRSGRVNMLAYVVWTSLFSVPPLFALSLFLEGWPAVEQSLRNADTYAWLSVFWQSVGNTLFGYVAWGWLLARHPAATITPLALLIPIVGMTSAVWWLDEPLPLWKVLATMLVIGGVALNILGTRPPTAGSLNDPINPQH